MIQLKRVYDPPAPEDGPRFLVERLWPRGVKREAAQLTDWLKDIAPSPALRQWFGHDPARWDEFKARYEAELDNPRHAETLQHLADLARQGTVTFVYAARDTEHNSARLLKEAIERRYLNTHGFSCRNN